MSMEHAKFAVKVAPGHTAHWYRANGLYPRHRFSWVYRSFANAVRHGYLRKEKADKYTVYYPTD